VETGIIPGFRGPAALTERFDVLELLGDGAAGFVYKVRDRSRNNQVMALKILADGLAFDEHTLDRFLQEIKICQSIKHPNLVEAYDLIEVGDAVAYTMELVDGGSLQKIFSQKKIGYEAIDRIMEQVLMALSELHIRGVVHRDIKMENVLLGTDGIVKLGDLGLMKELGADGFTKPGLLLGTPQYMPPEYVKNGGYDERGDIYTLGLLLYELVSGKRWLSHLRGQEVINYLIRTRFQINRASLAGVPRKYVEILSCALDHNPDKRYQTAAEMLAACRATPTVVEAAAPRAAEIKGGVSLERYSQLANSHALTANSSSRSLVVMALAFGLLIGILASAIVLNKRRASIEAKNQAPAATMETKIPAKKMASKNDTVTNKAADKSAGAEEIIIAEKIDKSTEKKK